VAAVVGWWIEIEAEIRFPADRLTVPDLAGWRVERVLERSNENPLTTLPDWVCEVLSPPTARDDRTLKLPLYAESGVGWVWLVDPELQTLEVYECLNARPTLAAVARSEDTPAPAPFGIELALKRLWTTEA
jgi:Uma2 family endonuclease